MSCQTISGATTSGAQSQARDGRAQWLILFFFSSRSTLMHLEADAKMNVYENSEGQKVSRLNLTQSTFCFPGQCLRPPASDSPPGNIEILSRPRTQESSEGPMSAESA